MISLKDIRYVRLGTANLDDAVRYATQILGLELVRRDRGNAYLRADDRDHTLAYTAGNPRDQSVAFEIGSVANSRPPRPNSTTRVIACAPARGSSASNGRWTRSSCSKIRAAMPSSWWPARRTAGGATSRRAMPASRASPTSGLHSTAPRKDEAFWTTVCNARSAIGSARLRCCGSTRCIIESPCSVAAQRRAAHQSSGKSIDDVMRSYYFLREKNVRFASDGAASHLRRHVSVLRRTRRK